MHHLRHLPPIVRLGVAMSCTAGTSGIVSADKVSQLTVNDDVRVKIVPCEWCLIVPGWLFLTQGTRSGRLRVVFSRLVLNQTIL